MEVSGSEKHHVKMHLCINSIANSLQPVLYKFLQLLFILRYFKQALKNIGPVLKVAGSDKHQV